MRGVRGVDYEIWLATPELHAGFWRLVDRSGGPLACWRWLGSTPRYGRVKVARKSRQASRVAWEITNGPIPPGLHALHRCDNPPCCNPAHLFLGTHRDNMQDRNAKGRVASGDQSGARTRPERFPTKLTPEHVIAIKQLYAAGGVSQYALARQFGVCQGTIWHALKGRTWTTKLDLFSDGRKSA